jgi:glycolate oxidase FAD binding subunit
MTTPDSFVQDCCDRVKDASARGHPLRIVGGDSKAFYGGPCEGDPITLSDYRGIIDYEPKELVLTLRAGTPLAEVKKIVADARQMLPFEPPLFGDTATIGGTIACGFSGPRRPYAGAARDFVLGTRIINGRGEDLRFGGRVIKNVAGYDVSRLMVGALGTLGILLDLSFKVLPRPAQDCTLLFDLDEATAIRRANEWAGKPLPLSACNYHDGQLRIRLSGAETAVRAAREKLGGDELADPVGYWRSVREHTHGFFDPRRPTWRLSVPQTTPPLGLEVAQLIEWGGGIRWLSGDVDPQTIRALAQSVGGHATLFRAIDKSPGVFQPLPPALMTLHRRLKEAFDPQRILNRGRLYPDL